jgi:hypothetical protein
MNDLVAGIADVTAPWAHRYGDSVLLQSLVMFVHLGSLLLAGGLAIASDRAALRAARPDGAAWRSPALAQIAAAHGPVLVGLAFALASGALLLAADVETFLASPVLWLKFGLIALLFVNGALLRRAQHAASEGAAIPGWDGLRNAAARSIALWFALVLVSVVMVNAPGTD